MTEYGTNCREVPFEDERGGLFVFISALEVLQISSSENGIGEGIGIRSHWAGAA